jgi:hypothetical protein
VLVDVEDGRIAGEPRRLILDRARWAELEVDLTRTAGETDALRAIETCLRPVVDEARGRMIAARVRLTGATQLHRAFAADPRRLADEVQAALHRGHEDVWLEKLSIATTDPRAGLADPGRLDVDLAAMLDACMGDEAVRRTISEELAAITPKLPGSAGGDVPPADEIETLLDAARALLLGRAFGTPA